MFSTSPDLPLNKTLQIKQDDKFFSRLLSKENSVASPFRVYYGGVSVAVPFMWESQPGTPKHTFSDTSLPPLTPPSYYSNSKPTKKHSRSGLLHALFPKMISWKKTNLVISSPSSSSSSSSWSSPPMFLAMSPGKYHKRNRFSTPCSSFDPRADDEEAAAMGSPASTLCFAIGSLRLVNIKPHGQLLIPRI